MSKEVSLKDFYNDANVEEEEEDSEQDSDFVPGDEDSEGEVNTDAEEDEEEEEEKAAERTNDKKRSLPSIKEDASVKKTRIDAIWADMNEPVKPAAAEAAAAAAAEAETSTIAEAEPVVVAAKKRTQMKRPKSTLSSLVSQYNIKEPKMNTLDKSKLDWQGYVDREGIRDDLKYKNKDGYMEKVAFLQRVDDRRLNHLKSGQKNEKK